MLENKASLFNEVRDKSGRVDVTGDFGVVNSESKSSVLTKSDGNTTVAAGEYTQLKLDNQADVITQRTIKSVDISVEKEVVVKDININHHKFNNQFIELSDFRNVNGNVIGGMMLNGTVLVKTYEPTLEKWVLIRRPISSAMFSQRLNIPTAPDQYGLDLNIAEDIRKYYIEKENEDDNTTT